MKLEVLEKDGYYHIYNRGINGCLIFLNDENKNFFLKQLSKYLVDKISIFGYCLMDNHFHLVIRLNEEEEIVTQAFSNFFNSYAKSINTVYNRTGSLFQEHLQRNRVENEEYLKQLIVYVHLNPVKHKFDKSFETYLHSSYRSFVSSKETSIDRDFILELFGGLENFKFYHDERRLVYEGIIDAIDKMDD